MGQAASVPYELVHMSRQHLARRPMFAGSDCADNGYSTGTPRMWNPLMLALAVAVAWVLVGLCAYRGQSWGDPPEPYTLVETLYVMTQIITTVGYGEYHPSQAGGYLFTALYVLTAIVLMASLGTVLTDYVVKGHNKIMSTALKDLHFARLPDLDLDGNEGICGMSIPMPALSLGNSAVSFSMSELSPGTYAFLRALLIWLMCVLAGVIFFCTFPGEEKSFIEAFYMSVMTTTTVGFGDQVPATEEGRVFTCIWMLVGTAAFANMIANFSAAFLAQRQLRKLERGDLTDITRDELFKSCHPEGDYNISRADFILFMMKDIGALNSDMVDLLSANFDELDVSKSGFLDPDCLEGVRRMRRPNSKPGLLPRFHTVH
mmetsp:Transcript_144461/g.255202  ORF Transcript_144461/g.255202 Transcript_144461/m.255202 type:complete len:374 (-) Transcript_144461:32-1153(-)